MNTTPEMLHDRSIDWYGHYGAKIGSLSFERTNLQTFYEQNWAMIDTVLELQPKAVLEAGCGLCRDTFVLAHRGIDVTVLDCDQRLIQIARDNAARLGIPVQALVGDFFQLDAVFAPDTFDVVFHSGVLEHFHDDDIRRILHQQLRVAPTVVFSVPIASPRNEDYFADENFRRLMSVEEWRSILSSSPFRAENIAMANVVEGRHDDLLIRFVRH